MGTRSSALITALAAPLLASALAACGPVAGGPATGGTETPGGTMTSDASQQPTAGRSMPAGFPVSPPPPASGKPGAGELTLSGTVEAGVEYGCLILNAGGSTYNLLGGDPAVVKVGARVNVRGRPDPGIITTCQQGTPFQVLEAHPA